MTLFKRSRKAAAATVLAGSMLVSGTLTTVALGPTLSADSAPGVIVTNPVKAEPAIVWSVLCQVAGRCKG